MIDESMNNRIPAVCPSCNAVFPSILALGGGSLGLEDCRTNCPYCGGDALFADGVYEFVGDVVKMCKFSEHPMGDLIRLKDILTTAQVAEQSAEVVADRIAIELPSFAAIGNLLRSKTGKSLAPWIAILVALLNPWVLRLMTNDSSPSTSQQVILNLYNAPPVQSPAPVVSNEPDRVGRNEPCPCGSGKKYKKCCGRAKATVSR